MPETPTAGSGSITSPPITRRWWENKQPQAPGTSGSYWSEDSKGARMMAAGGFSGAGAKTCVAPLERIKMLCQIKGMSDPTARPSIRGVAAEIFKSEGVLAFWKGNLANVVRIVPNKAVLFSCNDYYRSTFGTKAATAGERPAAWRLVACGAAAGVTTT